MHQPEPDLTFSLWHHVPPYWWAGVPKNSIQLIFPNAKAGRCRLDATVCAKCAKFQCWVCSAQCIWMNVHQVQKVEMWRVQKCKSGLQQQMQSRVRSGGPRNIATSYFLLLLIVVPVMKMIVICDNVDCLFKIPLHKSNVQACMLDKCAPEWGASLGVWDS